MFAFISPRVLIPLLLVATTGLLLMHLIPDTKRETYTAPRLSLPTVPVYGELPLVWRPYYGGGSGTETVIKQSNTSLRISTGADGGWYGARSALDSGIDLEKNSLSFSVYVYDWDQVQQLVLLFSSGQNFTDYYGINLKNYLSRPADSEWITITLDPSELQILEGRPKLATITDIAVRVVPEAGISTRVWLDDIMLITKQQRQAYISHTFDDGFAGTLEGLAALGQHNQVGTAFIIPEFLGTPGYLTQTQVDQLADAGWEIAGHGKDALPDLVPPDVDTQLAAMYQYLTEHEYVGREHFAYPNGRYNLATQSQVLEYFASGRTIDGVQQPPEKIIPQQVTAVTVSSSTPLRVLQDQVDRAAKEGTWLIFVWHDFTETVPVKDVEYRLSDFISLVAYIDRQEDVQVLPYGQVYNLLQDQ